MPFRLLVYLTHPHVDAWNWKPRHTDLILKTFPEMEVVSCLHSKEFLEKLPEADAVLVWFFKNDWLANASKLKWICTPAAGMDWIDVPPLKEGESPEPGKPAVWFGGFHGPLMAESVLGAALHFLKAFPLSKHMQEKKKWARIKISNEIKSLKHSRVTILGFGRIGRHIGKAFHDFGAKITGINRSGGPLPDWFTPADRLLTPDALADVLPETDHFILVLPGGDDTDGMVTSKMFDLLPSHSIFYNVGRGNPYREEDLVNALNQKYIAHAYLDVFDTEPLPETSLLWDFDNVLIQPHLSAASPHYLDCFTEEWLERFRALP